MASEHARRRGKEIRAARSRRWPKRPDFAAACGLNTSTIAAVELALRDRFSPDTIAAIEGALGWDPGEAERRGKGQRPSRVEDPEFARVRAAWPRIPLGARRVLADNAERAAE